MITNLNLIQCSQIYFCIVFFELFGRFYTEIESFEGKVDFVPIVVVENRPIL